MRWKLFSSQVVYLLPMVSIFKNFDKNYFANHGTDPKDYEMGINEEGDRQRDLDKDRQRKRVGVKEI